MATEATAMMKIFATGDNNSEINNSKIGTDGRIPIVRCKMNDTAYTQKAMIF